MPLAAATIILIISFILNKYFVFKSLKYLKEEYDLIKQNFLFFQVFYPPNKYYADTKGIKLKNKGAAIFAIGLALAIFCFIVLAFFAQLKGK